MTDLKIVVHLGANYSDYSLACGVITYIMGYTPIIITVETLSNVAKACNVVIAHMSNYIPLQCSTGLKALMFTNAKLTKLPYAVRLKTLLEQVAIIDVSLAAPIMRYKNIAFGERNIVGGKVGFSYVHFLITLIGEFNRMVKIYEESQIRYAESLDM